MGRATARPSASALYAMSLRGGLYTASHLLGKLRREKTLLDKWVIPVW